MAEEQGAEDRLSALFAELKAMKEENVQLRKDVLRMSYQRPPEVEEEQEWVPDEPDLSGLPDMQDDPEGWKKAYAARIVAHEQAKTAVQGKRAMTEAEQKKRAEELWASFREKYPDLSENTDRVEFAVQKAWKRGLDRGINMDRFVYGDTDLFFEDVVDEYKRQFGAPEKAKAEKAAEEEGPTDEETARAWGIFGGSTGEGGKKKGGEGEESLGSLTGDIRKWQRSKGLSW